MRLFVDLGPQMADLLKQFIKQKMLPWGISNGSWMLSEKIN